MHGFCGYLLLPISMLSLSEVTKLGTCSQNRRAVIVQKERLCFYTYLLYILFFNFLALIKTSQLKLAFSTVLSS